MVWRMSARFLAVVAALLISAGVGGQFIATNSNGCSVGYYFDMSSQSCLYCPVGSYGSSSGGEGTQNLCTPCPAGTYGSSRLAPEVCMSCPSPWSEWPAAGARFCAVKSGTYTVYSNAQDKIIPYPYMSAPSTIIFTTDTGYTLAITPEFLATHPEYRTYYSGDFALATFTASESSFAVGYQGFKCFQYSGNGRWRSASYASGGGYNRASGVSGVQSYGPTTVNTTYDPPEAGTARQVAYGEWVQIALPSEILLGQVEMTCGDISKAPRDFVILGSNDGIVWSLVSEHQATWTAVGQVKFFRVETGYRWRTFRFIRVVVRATGVSTDGETEIATVRLLDFEFRACQPGTFNTKSADNNLARACQACPKGTYSAEEAASDQCTPCPAGTWRALVGGRSPAECVQCGAGKYSGGTGATAESTCVAMPSGVYTTGSGLTSSLGCTQCRPGRYGNSLGCELCVSCPAGTYSGVIGLAGSAGCVKCNAGTYSTVAGATGSSECVGCLAGTYSAGTGASSSAACTRCAAGTFAAAGGTSACSRCGAGTFSGSDGATKCDQCAAGAYAYTNGMTACDLCNPGTYNNLMGLASCTACPAGTYAPSAGVSACPPCPAGSITALSGLSRCFQCAAGLYGGSSGLTVCAACSAGKFSTASGLTSNTQCALCQQGTYAGAVGLTSSAGCVRCGAGMYSESYGLTSSAGCVRCTAGGYSLGGGSACEKCQAGSYSTASGLESSARCLLCGAGSYSTGSGIQSSVGCAQCWAGTYSTGSGVQSSGGCARCWAGTYSDMPGATGPETCTSTLAGTYCTGTGFRNADECLPCDPGTYGTGSGGTDKAVCELCQRGKYQSLGGKGACDACPARQYAAEEGQTACSQCKTTAPISGVFMTTDCVATQDAQWGQCTVCDTGAPVLRPCSTLSDTQCGWRKCSRVTTTQPEYDGWWVAKFRCPPGQYLWGIDGEQARVCRQCPAGMIGRNGKYCELCEGALEEPYALDQSLCVCKATAVMSSEGGVCVCPAGRYYDSMRKACTVCPADTFGTPDGICSLCGAGNFSLTGATACKQCDAGKYRLRGTASGVGCRSCNEAANGGQEGKYAPDPGADLCLKCNRSCTGMEGWRDAGECPGSGGAWRVCLPCDWQLPGNATWISGAGGCVFACNTGFYRDTSTGGCSRCSTTACAAGFAWSDCSADADRGCDTECRNESKPVFHSKWVPSTERKCPWACEDGYVDTVSDYWMFQIRECVPSSAR